MDDLWHFLTDSSQAAVYRALITPSIWAIFLALLVGLISMVLRRPRNRSEWASLALIFGFFALVCRSIIFQATGVIPNDSLIGVIIALVALFGSVFFAVNEVLNIMTAVRRAGKRRRP